MKSYEECRFCDGKGCLACPGEALRAEGKLMPVRNISPAVNKIAQRSEGVALRLCKIAHRMEDKISNLRNPATKSQNWTQRRANMVAQMARDADGLEKVQCALCALSEAWDNGTCPGILAKVRTKVAIGQILGGRWPGSPYEAKEKARLLKAGIIAENFQEAHETLLALADPPDRSAEHARREPADEVQSMVGQIPGFFPTPEPVARGMVRGARIEQHHRVLEPSAGAGAIADVIRAMHPGVHLDCIEWNWTLRQHLERLGHPVIGRDFFEVDDGQKWDRIVQNPPFEDLADTDHVRHAYGCLSDGGILVSLISESPFFRKDKKAKEFREWLDEESWYPLHLDHDSFKKSGSGAQARIIVIEKGEEPPPEEPEGSWE